jgi:RNA polymerase sigma-70 factor (ECF subfamily)
MRQDDDLMVRVQQGDWDALATLLGRQEGPLFAFFHRLGCDPNSIEDLVQEVMIRIYEGRQRYDPARPFSPWLYGIARHVWKDHLRRQGRLWAFFRAVESVEDLASPVADPLERRQAGEEVERVRRALQRLPEEQRVTLILRHYHGLTYEEIAEALGLPLGTVKWRIHDAMRKLAQWLAVRGRGEVTR